MKPALALVLLACALLLPDHAVRAQDSGGGLPRGEEPASQAISANDVMWAFFTSVPMAGGTQK